MRLRYRVEGEHLVVRIEDADVDENHAWRLLQTMGVPWSSQKVPGSLEYRKLVPRSALPRLERAARMLKAELVPEVGEAVVSAAPARAAYEAARPFDPAPLLAMARSDPAGSEASLQEAFARLGAWAQENAAFATHARADLQALGAALQHAQAEARRRGEAERTAESRDLAELLKGVGGGDAFAAHAALKRLQDAVKKAGTAAPPPDAMLLPGHIAHFRGKLRPYQEEGVRFLLRRGLDGILADEMGLGKTIETIAAIEAAGMQAFVVCPANVLYNWKDEVERFTDESAAVWHQGRLAGPRDARFLLTTYDALRSIDGVAAEEAASRPVLVLDEAHYIRNPETLRAKLVAALPQKRRILLTGTPLVNSIEDYYELLRQVEPDRWGSRTQFRDSWLVDPGLFERYAQVRHVTAMLLQRAAKDVMLRRRKDEVLQDLPPRTIGVNHHELERADRVAYAGLEARAAETMRREAGNEVAVFAALHALRQQLANARVPVVLERVRELRGAGEAVVVYSHYLEPLRALARELGPEAGMLEGATPPKDRQALARRFGSQGQEQVLLAQMEAGGIGLNFTAARHVLFVHFGWTPAVHLQAMDRVHRIGQDRPVFVEFYVTPDTIDERMVRILLRKEADQNLVLADESDVLNRGAVAKLLAEDAQRRVKEAKAAAGLGDGGAFPG